VKNEVKSNNSKLEIGGYEFMGICWVNINKIYSVKDIKDFSRRRSWFLCDAFQWITL